MTAALASLLVMQLPFGPSALPLDRHWQVVRDHLGTFSISNASERLPVLKGLHAKTLEYKVGDNWVLLYRGLDLRSARVGIPLRPGHYRLSGEFTTNRPAVSGYYADRDTPVPAPEWMNAFPQRDRLWAVHQAYSSPSFTVPSGSAYMLTYCRFANLYKRTSSGAFNTVFTRTDDLGDLPLPGYMLTPGTYKWEPITTQYGMMGGYIVAE